MIVLETPISQMDGCRTNFICPSCNNRFCWFHVSPEKCEGCGKVLPAMDMLKSDLKARVNYHWIASLPEFMGKSVICL